METPNSNLLWMIVGTFAALSIGTGVRMFALRRSTVEVVKQRMGSLRVWWILTVLWSVAAIVGPYGAAVLLAVASTLGMREYLRLIGTTNEIGRPAIVGVAISGAIHYGLIVSEQFEMAKIFLPVVGMILLAAIRSVAGATKDYLKITAGVYWGAMLIIYGLSHALFLFELDSPNQPWVGSAGLFLFLVLLTEMNDIMQALVGRKFGRRKITPRVSPNKSLEGLIGGLLTTILLSIALSPWMTTLTVGRSWGVGVSSAIGAGIFISVFGFLGDINMSAVKRDAGVKDGSQLLPGMGGIIDRIDSLTFTAPAFYYFVLWVGR